MSTQAEDSTEWVRLLKAHVQQRRLLILRLSEEELGGLLASRKGITEFTLTKAHGWLKGVVVPCLCLIFGTRTATYGARPTTVAYVAVLHSKAPVATLDSRIKIKRTAVVRPSSPTALVKALGDTRFARDLKNIVADGESVTQLATKLSVAVIEALLAIQSNRGALRTATAGLQKPRFGTRESMQFDAVETALKAFGLTSDAPAAELELAKQARSSLAQARIMEDAAIEHDARVVPGYEFVGSDVTGRATFRNGAQTLEVYTANRRKLEEAFGVDLIYLNLFQQNIVMVQYKMLEGKEGSDDGARNWLYREDSHLRKQLRTMRLYRGQASSGDGVEGYRLSGETFYFKFVRRVGPSPKTNVLLPLSHFEQILNDVRFRSKSGSVKMAHSVLEGRYMRQTAFFSLIQSGYIGTDASTSEHVRALIKHVVDGGDALVVAVQRETSAKEEDADHLRRVRMYDDEEAGYH